MSNYERWEHIMGKTFDDVLTETLQNILGRVTDELCVAAERLISHGEGDEVLADFEAWAREWIEDCGAVNDAANREVDDLALEDLVFLIAALYEQVGHFMAMPDYAEVYPGLALEAVAIDAIVEAYWEPTVSSAVEEAERVTFEALEGAGE